MKTFDVSGDEVKIGIAVAEKPYPHVVLGEGGNKRATWVPLGNKDAKGIVVGGKIVDVGIVALRDKETGEPNGKFLIVAPRNGSDNRALILWRVSSGYRGSASISPGGGVTMASDQSYHSGAGALGSTAEVLAVLKPGQELRARRSGRRTQTTRARLSWDGQQVKVEFGDENLFAALNEDEPEGDYV